MLGWCLHSPLPARSAHARVPPRRASTVAPHFVAIPLRGARVQMRAAEKYNSIDELERAYRQMMGDEQLALYRGSSAARLMVIGDGPSTLARNQREGSVDESAPMLGRPGKLLDKILRSAGLDEDDVYITTLVKQRVSDYEAPQKPQAEQAVGEFIHEEIRLVDPKVVLLCGRTVKEALLPSEKRGITTVRGTWYDISTDNSARWYMPIFHPSYLLRNPRWTPQGPKTQTWFDIQAVKQKLTEL